MTKLPLFNTLESMRGNIRIVIEYTQVRGGNKGNKGKTSVGSYVSLIVYTLKESGETAKAGVYQRCNK